MARFRISIVELDDTGNPPSKDAQKWHVLVIYAEESPAEAIQIPPAVVTGRARLSRFVPRTSCFVQKHFRYWPTA